MSQDELKEEYDKYNTEDMFNALKESVEAQVVRTEPYKGFGYNIFPYEFQMVGMKKGRPVKNLDSLKNKTNLYLYGFNEANQIVEVKEGCEIEGLFDYQFLLYEVSFFKSLQYNARKKLQNVTYCYLKEGGLLDKALSKGRYGGSEQYYFYDDTNKLQKTECKQYDEEGNAAATIYHTFNYRPDGSLENIVKSTSMYEQVVYKEKK